MYLPRRPFCLTVIYYSTGSFLPFRFRQHVLPFRPSQLHTLHSFSTLNILVSFLLSFVSCRRCLSSFSIFTTHIPFSCPSQFILSFTFRFNVFLPIRFLQFVRSAIFPRVFWYSLPAPFHLLPLIMRIAPNSIFGHIPFMRVNLNLKYVNVSIFLVFSSYHFYAIFPSFLFVFYVSRPSSLPHSFPALRRLSLLSLSSSSFSFNVYIQANYLEQTFIHFYVQIALSTFWFSSPIFCSFFFNILF